MADASYQPAVYRKQGGDELVVASSGLLTVESGGEIEMESGSSMTFASGSGLALASGSSFSCATNLEIASGGSIVMNSAAAMTVPYVAVSSTATTITNSGVSWITGTTAGPDYAMAAPTRSGLWKLLVLNASSSGATHRASIYTGSTGRLISFSGAVTGNTLTLATSNSWNAELVSAGTSGWVCVRHGGVSEPALSNKST
jgi:hypothetical protein